MDSPTDRATISADLLGILCCPETRQPVRVAPPEVLERVWTEKLPDRRGSAPVGPLEGGLLRDDGELLLPVRAGIPIMLIDEAIPLPARVA
ncbi:MAG: hypothetical protein ACO1QR_10200 [Chthoniobacteraceae bacterium]